MRFSYDNSLGDWSPVIALVLQFAHGRNLYVNQSRTRLTTVAIATREPSGRHRMRNKNILGPFSVQSMCKSRFSAESFCINQQFHERNCGRAHGQARGPYRKESVV